MPVLRVSDVPLSGERRRVEMTWQDGPVRRVAVSTFTYRVDQQEGEQIRWYLEDYAEFRAAPAPVLALEAETRLSELGADLFRRAFTSQDAAAIWAQVQARLNDVRVEVDTDPADAPGLPWELLQDPSTGTPLSLGAATFVRTHLQTARQINLPTAAGEQLRVLLVICRPGGRADVPFRSVASRLVRGGAAHMRGLRLHVLRPATYPRLAEVLRQAAQAGRPYHIVHFDGHGTYLDLTKLRADETPGNSDGSPTGGDRGIGLSPLSYGVSVAGPIRPGQHGYLIFEDPSTPTNQQLVDGPALGRLLAATEVPVLVLNACRSAYAEASPQPADPDSQPDNADSNSAGYVSTLVDDVHARIRAYGSMAVEIADAGVPGVVAMRYNIYVAAAAQYVSDLYAHLLAGKSLGQAATNARRALADNPTRQIGAAPVALQDWAVPVVYEAAPLTLLDPEQRDTRLIHLTLPDQVSAAVGTSGEERLPRPPDVGFFGRDETLLALDRTFDTHRIVLLYAYAGAGKTTTAAEFARWYQATGALQHPALGSGPVLWSSFEGHLTLAKLLDTVGDCFAGMLEASGTQWQAITDHTQRRSLALQLLEQVPVLWVWDNIEPVTGFPPGTSSAWTQAEQDQIASFLRDLAQTTQCKVLLTSRRSEQDWLGHLPARVQLPPMPMRERLQFARALAARHGDLTTIPDWRPLLRYSAGNPLTITVLVSQALRDRLTTTADLEAFVERLKAGEQELEHSEDAAFGRTRSLAASLDYGFNHAFTGIERAQLAVLHLFRGTIDADALPLMGVTKDPVPALAELAHASAIALLDRAADVGLLSSLGNGYYAIHPALPWHLATVYAATYGQANDPPARSVAHAYTHTIALLGAYYHEQYGRGTGDPILALRLEEANLQHALTLARQERLWQDVVGCMQGLLTLYRRTGRDGEWAQLVADVIPDFIDPDNDEPLPGREGVWYIITEYRVWLATNMRDWPTATRLQHARVAWNRSQAARALATPDSELTRTQRDQIQSLAATLQDFGEIQWRQDDPGCLASYQEAFALCLRIGDRIAEVAIQLGNVYYNVPGVRDLDQAEHWYRYSLDHRDGRDTLRHAEALYSLANVAYARFQEVRNNGEPEVVWQDHLNAALVGYKQALELFRPDDAENRAGDHHQLGRVYAEAGDARQALHHYQQAIRYAESSGNTHSAVKTRYWMALLFERNARADDALLYARAALHDLEGVGAGHTPDAGEIRDLIARIEQQIAEPGAG